MTAVVVAYNGTSRPIRPRRHERELFSQALSPLSKNGLGELLTNGIDTIELVTIEIVIGSHWRLSKLRLSLRLELRHRYYRVCYKYALYAPHIYAKCILYHIYPQTGHTDNLNNFKKHERRRMNPSQLLASAGTIAPGSRIGRGNQATWHTL